MACAMVSCDRRRSTPAAWVSNAPAKRIEVSRSGGMPSIDEDELDNWSGVARALERVLRPDGVGGMVVVSSCREPRLKS